MDNRDFEIFLDLCTVIPSPGARHRVFAGVGLTADEYRTL